MIRRSLVALLFLTGMGAVAIAHAQLGSTDPITIEINPDYPRPYQIITVTPDSNLIDLSASTVTLSVNGAVVQRGTGQESASVAVGGPGQTTTVTVTAVNNGVTYTKSITIRPADVSLILEPTSTTHPFYEGGSLIGSEGNLRLIAVPDLRTSSGASIPASSLVYTWKNSDQILQGSSGIGKMVLSAVAPLRYRDTTITVTVSTQDQSVVAQAQMLIAATDPFIRVYENDPLEGPRYDTAIQGQTTLSGSEATYRAVPYFFTQTPSLTWSMNGTPSQTGQDITVRPSGSGKGTAQLGVSATSGSFGQSTGQTLSVTFGSKSTGIFGL